MRRTVVQAVWDGCEPEPNSGCWLWLGALQYNGYARVYADGNSIWAHRASYTAFVGPIPRDLEIDHRCRVRSCVNPTHLRVVTRAENLRGRIMPSRAQTACNRGHVFSAENTYKLPDGRRHCRTCHQERQRRYWRAHYGKALGGVFVAPYLNTAKEGK